MERIDVEAAYSPVEMSIHLARYAFAAQNVSGQSVLDAACGQGLGSAYLSQYAHAKRVFGVDIDPLSIERARKLSSSPSTQFDVFDLNTKDLATKFGQFDSVICIETLEHLRDPSTAIAALKSAWNSEGDFVVTWPNDALYYGRGRSLNKYHLNQLSFIAFRNLVEEVMGRAEWYFGSTAAGFGVYRLQSHVAQEATYHTNLSHVSSGSVNIVPAAHAHRLTPTDALFFVGVWRGAKMPRLRQSITSFPASSRYRVPYFLNTPLAVQAGYRPKMLLVADIEGWAFDNIAQHIKKYLGTRFNITVAYQQQFAGDWLKSIHHYIFASQYDYVHFFWRETILDFIETPWVQTNFMRRFNISIEDFARRMSETIITTSIYDHLFLSPDDIARRRGRFKLLDGLSAASSRLSLIYRDEGVEVDATIEDGVDLALFAPRNLERFSDTERPLVVGWVGNSDWNSSSGLDRKGFHTILRPAIEKLVADGHSIVGHFADRAEQWRPRAEMPQYYSEIDVLVCSSEIEGTPNPVLEAMASGVPVISTDVGIVAQVLGPEQRAFILKERSVDAMAEKLLTLLKDRAILSTLSSENRTYIQSGDWFDRMPKWLNFFKRAEERNKAKQRVARSYLETLMQQRMHMDALEAEIKAKSASNVEVDHEEVVRLRKAIQTLRQRIKTLEGRADDAV